MELQMHYDGILQQVMDEVINLRAEVEALKKSASSPDKQKSVPVEVDIIPSKTSLKKLRDTIAGLFK